MEELISFNGELLGSPGTEREEALPSTVISTLSNEGQGKTKDRQTE